MISAMEHKRNITVKRNETKRNKSEKLSVNFRFVFHFYIFPLLAIFCLILLSAGSCWAQTKKPNPRTSTTQAKIVSNLPKVTQINEQGLKNLLKPNGKPLLINFWATWCDPCREEFPDLVKIGADYKDKIDLITISLDEISEINGDVPKFLAEMKSDMPAYLLKTPDDGSAINLVSKDWQGALPFTVLYNANGETVYLKQGKFKTDFLRAAIEDVLKPAQEKAVQK
jgi:thiol-disulfide isomerase/thioredoxin